MFDHARRRLCRARACHIATVGRRHDRHLGDRQPVRVRQRCAGCPPSRTDRWRQRHALCDRSKRLMTQASQARAPATDQPPPTTRAARPEHHRAPWLSGQPAHRAAPHAPPRPTNPRRRHHVGPGVTSGVTPGRHATRHATSRLRRRSVRHVSVSRASRVSLRPRPALSGGRRGVIAGGLVAPFRGPRIADPSLRRCPVQDARSPGATARAAVRAVCPRVFGRSCVVGELRVEQPDDDLAVQRRVAGQPVHCLAAGGQLTSSS